MDHWEKIASEQFKQDQEKAKSEASADFAVSIVLGVLFLIVYACVEVVQWFLFDHAPSRRDVKWWLFAVVIIFAVNKWVSPLIEAHYIRSKRAIRIEAKLDYLLEKHKATHDFVLESERKATLAIPENEPHWSKPKRMPLPD